MRGLSGFLSSWCSGLRPYLKLRLEPQGSSPVLTWILGFLWSFNRGLRPCLLWRHGTPLSSRGFKEVSGFLLRGHRSLGLFLEVSPGCHTSFRVVSQSSVFQSSQCRRNRLIRSGWGNWGLFELRHDPGDALEFHGKTGLLLRGNGKGNGHFQEHTNQVAQCVFAGTLSFFWNMLGHK